MKYKIKHTDIEDEIIVVNGVRLDIRLGGESLEHKTEIISCPICHSSVKVPVLSVDDREVWFSDEDNLHVFYSKDDSTGVFAEAIGVFNDKIINFVISDIEKNSGCSRCKKNMSCNCEDMENFQFI